MNIDKKLIKHWAMLFESEDVRRNGDSAVRDDVEQSHGKTEEYASWRKIDNHGQFEDWYEVEQAYVNKFNQYRKYKYAFEDVVASTLGVLPNSSDLLAGGAKSVRDEVSDAIRAYIEHNGESIFVVAFENLRVELEDGRPTKRGFMLIRVNGDDTYDGFELINGEVYDTIPHLLKDAAEQAIYNYERKLDI